MTNAHFPYFADILRVKRNVCFDLKLTWHDLQIAESGYPDFEIVFCLRTTPARAPRTECCCQLVVFINASSVVPPAGKSFEKAIRDHGSRTTESFFRGLKDEDGGSGKIARFREVAGGVEQDGHMAVMPEAVKNPGIARTERQVCRLVDGQGIKCGAKTDPAAYTLVPRQYSDDSRPIDIGLDLDTPARKQSCNRCGRPGLLESQFGY